jgi:hypothetical protein
VRFKPSEIERWIESKTAGIPAAECESVAEGARTEGGEA